MIVGYVSIREKAEEWGITPRRVQTMCAAGRIEGAGKIGNMWVIPIDAKRPIDKRVTTGKYRNWRKKQMENRGVEMNQESLSFVIYRSQDPYKALQVRRQHLRVLPFRNELRYMHL